MSGNSQVAGRLVVRPLPSSFRGSVHYMMQWAPPLGLDLYSEHARYNLPRLNVLRKICVVEWFFDHWVTFDFHGSIFTLGISPFNPYKECLCYQILIRLNKIRST